MKFAKTIKVSSRQLMINRSKSLFAIIGLSVGIASVITMVAIGDGAKIAAIDQLNQLGTNLITINAGKVKKVMERRQNSDLVSTLRMKDCEIILNRCSSIKEAVPSLAGTLKAKYGNTTTLCMVNGVSTPYFRIKNFRMYQGDLFSPLEDKLCRRVAVLGWQVSKTLFEGENPVGKTLLIGRVPFTVIGVLKSKGTTTDGSNLDAQVLIPINTALRRIFNQDYLNRIFVEVSDPSQMQKAENEIVSTLRDYHRLDARGKENDFTIDNQLNDIRASESSARSFSWLIAGVALVALIVGGIGILGVMLLSVRERTPEIGLRLSVGAKRRDIVRQFLIESAILGFTGGLTGFVTGFIASEFARYLSKLPVVISPVPVLLSLLFSILIGLIFGVFPARKASKADPVAALNWE